MDIRKYVTARVDEFKESPNYKLMLAAKKAYSNGEEEDDARISPDFRRATQRKTNYLLGREYTVENAPTYAKELSSPAWLSLLKGTAKEAYRSGIAFWELEPNDKRATGFKPLLRRATQIVPIWADENHDELEAYIYLFTDIVIKEDSSLQTIEFADYVTTRGRERVNLSNLEAPIEQLPHAYKLVDGEPTDLIVYNSLPIVFIKCSDDETSLYRLMYKAADAYSEALERIRSKIDKNGTSPVWEIGGYSATEDDSHAAIKHNLEEGIVLTEGTGKVACHAQSLDTVSNEAYLTRLRDAVHEASATVDKKNELQYAVSGKAMDRLYIDMEGDARDIGEELQEGIKRFLAFVADNGGRDETAIKVIWNTDKTTDEPEIINSIVQSRGIISDRTLLAQHPWVVDVDEELEAIKTQKLAEIDFYQFGTEQKPYEPEQKPYEPVGEGEE